MYIQHITITNIRISMHSYNGLIQVLMLITDLCLFGSPVGVTELILIQRYPVGITDQNDTHSFTLIPHSGYFHITKGIPRPVIINE